MKRYPLFSGYGILNGKYFAKDYDHKNWQITETEARILELGPEHPTYKSTWESIKTRTFEFKGFKYNLEETSDYSLFLIEM